MTKVLSGALQTLLGFALVLTLVPTLLLAVISTVNDDEVRKNLWNQAEQQALPQHRSYPNSFGIHSDAYTDCLTASMIVFGDPGRSSLEKLADTDFIRTPEADPCQDIGKSAKQVLGTVPYPRYWHGALILSLPMLSFASFDTVRITASLISAVSLACFLYFVVLPRLGILITLSILLLIASATDILHASGAFTHKLAISALFLATTVVYLVGKQKPNLLPLVVVGAAGIVAMFDLIVVTPVVPMYFASAIVLQSYAATLAQNFTQLALFLPLIVSTYIGLTAERVVLFLEYGKSLGIGWFDTFRYLVDTWSVSSKLFPSSPLDAGRGILANFFLGHGAVAGLLIVGVAIAISFYRETVRLSHKWPFALMAVLIMFVWLFLMSAHALVHASIIGGRWIPLMLIPIMLLCFHAKDLSASSTKSPI